MTIKSKFSGRCRDCGGPIHVGEQIEWERGVGSTHTECPTLTADERTAAVVGAASGSVGVTEAGVYETPEGAVYVVKPNRAKTRLYAKRLVEIGGSRLTDSESVVQIDFEYESGAIYRLAADMKMPIERAKELTVRYGRCIVCGRHLKDAHSVERGIGPVCAKSFSGVAA